MESRLIEGKSIETTDEMKRVQIKNTHLTSDIMLLLTEQGGNCIRVKGVLTM
jgi:hypothetical protein